MGHSLKTISYCAAAHAFCDLKVSIAIVSKNETNTVCLLSETDLVFVHRSSESIRSRLF